ncbi:MAG: NAD-dependent epimerase/dehydratase family protein [Coriobacteriales bacterium]|nr:NAD-dependent epimerase/dehydratase family protein [Coriobacteriales bacterium]
MKVLFIGGTGFISAAASRSAIAEGLETFVLNRGSRIADLPGSIRLTADVRSPGDVRRALQGLEFDVVVDWIAFTPDDIERDLDLFRGRVKQYVFVSSASAYEKPPTNYLITESTRLHNPFWEYSRGKILCEERLAAAHRDEGFPVTIVRPSMTYDTNLPIALGGWGTYTLADRLMRGRPVIVHGDGSSLWVVTHADDLARGLLGLLGNERAVGEAFHITSDEVLTWNQIYQTIAEALGVEADIVHIPSDFIAQVAPGLSGSLLGDKTWSVVFDNSKIKAFVPGFRADVPFREGIGRTLEWFAADASRRFVDEGVNAEMDSILAAYAGTRR